MNRTITHSKCGTPALGCALLLLALAVGGLGCSEPVSVAPEPLLVQAEGEQIWQLCQKELQKRAFTLDRVTASGNNMIAVWATHQPRIVLFGPDLRCPRSLFFESADQTLTLNCRPEDPTMSVTRQLTFGAQTRVVTFTAPRDLHKLIWTLARSVPSSDGTKPIGPGLTFSEIVGVLYQLTQKNIIPATFTPLQRVKNNP